MHDTDLATATERILAMRAADASIGVKRITEHIKRDFPAITTKHVRTILKQNPSRPLDEGVELHSGSESNGPLLDHPPPAFRIVAVPGKGMGMFAVRDIRPGELVLREAPLMTMTWDEEDDDQHAARAKALSQSSKTTFFGLHDKDASEDEPTAKGIWETNAMQLGLTDSGGVFSLAARINHSCRANLVYHWAASHVIDEDPVHALAGCVEIYCVASVRGGEELTICYGDPYSTRSERRADLFERYGFLCRCEACENGGKISETRRLRIGEIQTVLQDGLMRQPFRNIDLIEQALDLLEEEGLHGLRHEFTAPAYRITYNLGMLEDAKRFARLSYEYGRTAYGESDSRVQEWKNCSVKPMKPVVDRLMDPVVQAALQHELSRM